MGYVAVIQEIALPPERAGFSLDLGMFYSAGSGEYEPQENPNELFKEKKDMRMRRISSFKGDHEIESDPFYENTVKGTDDYARKETHKDAAAGEMNIMPEETTSITEETQEISEDFFNQLNNNLSQLNNHNSRMKAPRSAFQRS